MQQFTILTVLFSFLTLVSGTAQAVIAVNNDTFNIPADGVLIVEPEGVMANDTMDDADGSAQFVLDVAANIILTVITPPSQGTLTCPGVSGTAICQDGSFEFSVDPTSFTGVDHFTYRLEVDDGLATYEFAEATVELSACSTTGTMTTCWSEGAFFDALSSVEDAANPFYVKHEGFEGDIPWGNHRATGTGLDTVYNAAAAITSKGITWTANHVGNLISTSEGASFQGIGGDNTGRWGILDPDHGHATNTSIGECQALEAADPNGVVPEECLPHDGFSGSSATTLYAVGGYIKGSNSAANISVSTDGGAFTNIGKLITPAHQFYGIIDTNGFNSFRFHDIDGKTGQPLYIFGDDFYLVTRQAVDANQAPVLAAVTSQTVTAGSLFQIDVPVSDPDDDVMSYVLSGIPTGTGAARLIDNGNSVRIRWFTTVDSAGPYSVSIAATDNGYPRITSVVSFDLTILPPPPTLSLPGNITQEATSSSGASVTYSATASDITDGPLTPTCSPLSGSTFALGTTTVGCSVTNSSSLTTSGSFIVNIVDTTPPSVTAPASIMLEASGAKTAVSLGSASASDLVSGALTPLPGTTGPFTVGIHSIIWSATDAAGNEGTATQTVTIVDTQAPSMSLPTSISTEATGPGGAVVNFTATGNDSVTGLITAVCTPASGSTFGLGTTIVSCSVTDGASNSTSGSFNVTVVDTTNPAVTAPLDVTVEATGSMTAVSLGAATATDLVSGSLVATANNTGPFSVGVHAITWTATDSSGNSATATQTVTVTDTTGPALTLAADFSAEATSAAGAAVTYTASASDLVNGAVAISCTPVSGSTFILGTTLVSCNASDNSTNSSSGSFNITVQDTTAPVVTVPLDITMEATGSTTAVTLGSATATDAVTANLTPTADLTGPFGVGTHSITWSATDGAGNVGTAVQTVTITDTLAPVLTLSANINAEASSASGAIVNYSVSASDIADGALTPSCSPVSGSNFTLGMHTVSCSVSDSSNLTASGSFTITVADTTAPVVTTPANITVEASGTTTSVNLGTASATDLVDGSIVPSPDNPGPFSVGVHTITWSATDTANNTGSATQIVTITDTGAPVLTLPANMTVEADAASGATVSYTVSASDIVDGVLTPACTPASGSTFALGTTSVSCSVTDSASLTTSGGFNISVVDTTAPIVSAPLDVTTEATGLTTAVSLGVASAMDQVSGVITPIPSNNGPFTVGVYNIIWSATDTANNTGTASQTVTITDTTAPSLNLPADISQGAASAAGAIVNYSASANDIAEGSIVVSCLPASGSMFTIGTTAVNCSATDSSNNSASASFNVTVADTGAPTLSLPANITAEATSASGAIVSFTATANDAIDGVIAASCIPASGSTFGLGNNAVNCSAQDLEGNSASAGFTISIIDTTPPGVTAPVSVSVEATGVTTPVTLGNASATDLVSGTLTPSASSSGPFTVGVHTITWTATDAANNTGSATQTVTITDTTAPMLSLPTGIRQEATSAAGAMVSYSATANDIVDGVIAANCVPASGSTFALGISVVTCNATDSSSLTTTGSFNVSVVDTTPPVVTSPANISIEATGSFTAVSLGTATANDTVSGVLTAVADNLGPFAVGVHTITWSATDAANNTGSATQLVTVNDIGSPSLNLPANITSEATAGTGAVVNYTVSATDVVDGTLSPTCSPLSGSSFALGITTVNCSATDSSNQTTSGSFTVTVQDTTGPTLTLPADVTVNATASAAVVRYTATANDVVDGSVLANCSPLSGSSFALGTTLVNCSATDGSNNTTTGSFNILVVDSTVINDAPNAHAGMDQNVLVGDLVTLDGSLSSDVNGDTLTYQWVLNKPLGSSAVLVNATSAHPEFTADVAGSYAVQLVVNDGLVDSILAASVTITAQLPVDVAPTITAPADITVDSSGYLTPVALGVASATDPEDGVLLAVADNTGPFAPGRHVITWSVTDSANNTVSDTQLVDVLPMVNFPIDQQAEPGRLVHLTLTMNGFAPEYPVDINYDVTANGVTSSNTASIASGKTAIIDYQLPASANDGETITFTLKSAVNAVPGTNKTHTVTLITRNVAPIVDIGVTQNGVATRILHSNGGPVIITANIHDDNQGDTHTLDWSTTDNNIPVPGSLKTFTIDPSNLSDGHYKIGVKVVDSGLLEAENEIYVRVTSQDFNPKGDSDHDGIEDALEGDHDDDEDGVPNYLDAIEDQSEMLQMQAGESSKWVLATESGLSLRLGKTAQLNGRYAASITAAELANFAGLGRITAPADTNDNDHTAVDGYLDFTINGLNTAGHSVRLIIPLLSPIPDQAVYRKYNADTGWSNFVEDAANSLSSAPGADGICPAPGSDDYLPGLAPGDFCIQMFIQDGGPNDNDRLANGVVTDPGGVAVAKASTASTTSTPASSGGGGGAMGIMHLLAMMMLLSVSLAYRRYIIRKKLVGEMGK